jgi:hypothetical protein
MLALDAEQILNSLKCVKYADIKVFSPLQVTHISTSAYNCVQFTSTTVCFSFALLAATALLWQTL